MLLGEIAECLDSKVVGNPGQELTGIQYDSRKIRAGNLFVCIDGAKTDGHHYIGQAVKNGASAVLVQRIPDDLPRGLSWILVPDTRKALADVSRLWFGNPAQKVRLIGVTGTNGKTTTSHLIKSLLEKGDSPVGLIGTVHNLVGDEELTATHTTPESLELCALLDQMVEKKSTLVVMEVSSHALKQHRVAGCEYDGAVFTNLTQDHLDYHSGWEDYLSSKLLLFQNLHQGKKPGAKYAVINADDRAAQEFIQITKVPVWTYGIKEKATVKAVDIKVSPRETSFYLIYHNQRLLLQVPLVGMFNVYNVLAAVTVALAEGLPISVISHCLKTVSQVPGRFELVDMGQPFSVVVDYAHTPDGLENILSTAREITPGRLITVFGCGGDRDRGKRPIMGQIALKFSDFTVITSDNPRSEDPEKIISDIEQGIVGLSGEYTVEPERRRAIERAIKQACPGDTVIIAGKGHETYQLVKGQAFHFDDREETRIILRRLGFKN